MSLGHGDMGEKVDLGESPGNGQWLTAENLPGATTQRDDDGDSGANRQLRTAVTRPRWEIGYARAVAVVDLAAMAVSLGLHRWWGEASGIDGLPLALGLGLITLTAVVLGLVRAWDPSVLGVGAEEFNRLLRALATVAVVVGLVGLALKLSAVRPYVFGVIPVAFLLAAIGRVALRKVLHRHRRNGACLHEILAVGTEDAVAKLIACTRRATHHGWTVTGACTPSGGGTDGGRSILGVPVVGDLDSVAKVAGNGRYRVVSAAQAPGWTSRRLHHGDRLAACLLLLLIAPVMMALAIAVRSDGGPVFYRQPRVGRHGKLFPMIKFRSMVVNADQRRSELADGNQGAGPLFKLRQDPRVTPIGAFLRKYSLDELPQLFNVLAGPMSLVGPRPPLPEEVACYSRAAQRKLLVKPGLTGLWQISGPQRPVLGGIDPAGSALRGELVPRVGRFDYLEDGRRSHTGHRRLLTNTMTHQRVEGHATLTTGAVSFPGWCDCSLVAYSSEYQRFRRRQYDEQPDR